MPVPVKKDWQRMPEAFGFNSLGTESVGPVAILASQAVTTIQGPALLIPCGVKVAKVGIYFGAVGVALGAGLTLNVVYGTNTALAGGAYAANGVAPQDNAYTGAVVPGTSSNANAANAAVQPGGLGVTTNYAVNNQALFATDIQLTVANFPGATQAAGGINIFTPTNPDAVYPSGFLPLGGGPVVGYFTLRALTPVSGTIANVNITLFYEPVTPGEDWFSGNNPQNVPVPGISF